MLEPVKHILAQQRVILASGSPRRKEILSTALPSIDIKIIPSKAEENLDPTEEAYVKSPWKFAENTAKLKADDIMREEFARAKTENVTKPIIVIGADTVVTFNGKIFGKPKTPDHAIESLKLLSGQTHVVYSGVCLLKSQNGELVKEKLFSEGTEVTFDTLSDQIVRGYVESGEPMDKAGAYGIQASGGTLVKAIHGDYFNVVGFPLHKFCKELSTFVCDDL